MYFSILSDEDKVRYYDTLLQILTEVDHDFVPALSERIPTVHANVHYDKDAVINGSVRAYLDNMLGRGKIVGVFLEERLVGVVSYLEDECFDMITEKDLPNIYICTAAISPDARGMGITKKIYAHLFHVMYPDRNIFTRTWSTNIAHIKILEFFGFQELKRLTDDRGEGIDTVYFVKRRTP